MGVSRTLASLLTIVASTLSMDRVGAAYAPVTVCLNPGANAAAVFQAERSAARMLAEAGVRLDWQGDLRRCNRSASGIAITLMLTTPPDQHPGAMAYARPYGDPAVTVFYDRVMAAAVAPLLAHVLAHEIAHVLEGVAIHSATGIMKAKWTPRDYTEMRHAPLRFTEEDLLFIRRGLEACERRK